MIDRSLLLNGEKEDGRGSHYGKNKHDFGVAPQEQTAVAVPGSGS